VPRGSAGGKIFPKKNIANSSLFISIRIVHPFFIAKRPGSKGNGSAAARQDWELDRDVTNASQPAPAVYGTSAAPGESQGQSKSIKPSQGGGKKQLLRSEAANRK
jgi:hypothetical protein